MISGTFESKEIGKTYYGIIDGDLKYHPDQPYTILREASKEEYFEYLKTQGVKLNSVQLEKINNSNAKFYELSID